MLSFIYIAVSGPTPAGMIPQELHEMGPAIEESFLQEVESKMIKMQLVEIKKYLGFMIVCLLSELLGVLFV